MLGASVRLRYFDVCVRHERAGAKQVRNQRGIREGRVAKRVPGQGAGTQSSSDAAWMRSSLESAQKQSRAIIALPLAASFGPIALTLLPQVRANHRLTLSLLGAGLGLMLWHGVVMASCIRRRRVLSLEPLLRPHHYIQAVAQGSVMLYWGCYWRPVYDSAHLLLAQVLFAYGIEMLLAWTRRDTYRLGFGPLPVVFSINLFLWFRPEWFWLQFMMIATAFLAKELMKWQRNGMSAHIFNPSAFALAVFSFALIVTGSSGLTRGEDIATTLTDAPHIYLFIFVAGLPGQLLFGVTTMTMAAVMAMYVSGLLYFAVTGVYFFVDAYIPIAVFLGMHLLFTDPSTSPRTELGRLCFGVLYAWSVMALYVILGHLGAPTFYDKLMAVPLMNLCVKGIDRFVASGALTQVNPAALGEWLVGRSRNLAYITIWTTLFVTLSAVNGVGDSHRGQWVTFWQQACEAGRAGACRVLGVKLIDHCRSGSGWACNEYGILLRSRVSEYDAQGAFQRACSLGFGAGCANGLRPPQDTAVREAPRLSDYSIILHRAPGASDEKSALALYNAACMQGFETACESSVE